MNLPRERDIQKAIVEYLNCQKNVRVFVIRNGATWDPTRRVYRSSSSEKGLPDIAGSYKGTFIAIEVKSKRGKPTVEQVQFLEQIKLTGGIAGVARSIEDVQKIILSHLDRSPQKKEQAPEVVRQESICP